MSGPSATLARGLLFVGVVALGLLAAEGASSLVRGRSLLRAGAADVARAPPTDADRRAAARRNPGVYRVHPDPFVSYVLRADEQLEIAGRPVHSDALGLRVRPGPPPPAGAARLVVLGDSVAFGYGLADDETLAARIEEDLRAVQGGQGRPVVARTVAMPGWNFRNAMAFLFDHWAELQPDIVVYIPIGNDLCDSDGLFETGQRRVAPDLANPDPLQYVRTNNPWSFLRPLKEQLEREDKAGLVERLGPSILTSDLSAESRRRYDADAASIVHLQRRLAQHGGHLLLARYEEARYAWHLERRLVEARAGIPVVPLFTGLSEALQLADDPHANALGERAAASWVAADLLARGWVEPGAGHPLPPVPPEAEAQRGRPHDDDEIVARSKAELAVARRTLRSVLDWREAIGLNQVYGTINDDGSAGTRLLVALAPGGDTLAIDLAALADEPDLSPLEIGVEVDGRPLEPLVLAAGPDMSWRLKLPPRSRPDDAIEVRLVPARWVVREIAGSLTIASFRPLRIASEP